ncbi:MAG: NAD(P) transhydrogenase subunit alpha [Phycisphaerales bacterium]
MRSSVTPARCLAAASALAMASAPAMASQEAAGASAPDASTGLYYISMITVFMLATFIGIGAIRRVSRLLHTPLMSLTNAISAIAVVGSIMVAGASSPDTPLAVRIMGSVAVFASMTNIISGFMITDRMLKMFKTEGGKA